METGSACGDPLLTDELRAWIGREVTYTAPEALGHAAIRYFALALRDDNPLYRDEAFARATRHGGVVAPPTLVCETSQYVGRLPGEDGYAGHVWDLPLHDVRFIRAGNDYEFFQPVRPDDRLTVTWRLADISERATRRGPRLFVVSEVRYVNQHGALLAINRETNVYGG